MSPADLKDWLELLAGQPLLTALGLLVMRQLRRQHSEAMALLRAIAAGVAQGTRRAERQDAERAPRPRPSTPPDRGNGWG